MNAMYLIYVPIAVLFAVFVIYAGLIMPARDISESWRDRQEPRGPDEPADGADVLCFSPSSDDHRKVAA
ncbi:hypothetical protein [Actinomadura sp. 6N118]|uniref:hypothetical protein n=1 Tax=Actinomadura sp. 6N118 TaxID=3375151 RepID=UPI0037B18E10